MIIFLYGEDSYRSREKLREIIAGYQKAHKSGLSLRYVDCKEADFQGLKDEVNQISIFNEKKLIILSNLFLSKEFKERFSEHVKNFLKIEDIIVVYESEKISGKESFSKVLAKQAESQEFAPLSPEKLIAWIKHEFSKYQGKLDIGLGVPEALIFAQGADTWALSNEIQKLVAFKKGKKIEKTDVQLLVKPKIDSDIFRTIDAIGRKDKKMAISLLHNHLEKGESPLYLLSMINYQLRNLIIIKSLSERMPYYAVQKQSGLNPFVVRKTYEMVRNFSFQELKKIYLKLFRVDMGIKTGKILPVVGLDLFVTEI